MEIEDIINQVRFTSSEDRNARQRSIREGTDTSIISASRSAAESSSCSDTSSYDGYATYEPDVSQTTPFRRQRQERNDAEVQRELPNPSHRQRARRTLNVQDAQKVPRQPPLQQVQQSMALPYIHAMPSMYFPAYVVVSMHMPPTMHIAPHSTSLPVPQKPHHIPQQPQWTEREDNHFPKAIPRGVRIPPLPGSFRRTPKRRKLVQFGEKKTKKKIKARPVVREYDHLSVEEAIQELALRDIHITDVQQIDITKTTLVRLLQRADRNNNKGSGKSNEI